MRKFLLVIGFYVFLISTVTAQFNEFEPQYNWMTIKGKHVKVHFHEGAERTARVVLEIADEVWDPITSLYQYEPDEVHYVIKDIDDYSNGATYFFDNKIEIWASALDFDLRGTHNWLRNVISHEFTHMVQIQAAMKIGRTIPAFYLQFLNYEDKRRQDILYGFPNIIASYPVATFNMPAWFAEGTAQYMRHEFEYEWWDSHRDMILRSYVLDGNMLTWNQMGVFSKTSLGNESVYNSGFALTKYIAQQYGEDKLREITKKLGKITNFTIDAAFEDVLHKDGNEIYNEWKEFLTKDYNERIQSVRDNEVSGEIIADIGFGNFYPVFNEDETKVIYISNKTSDYFGQSGIYSYDLNTKEEKLIVSLVTSTVSFIPGTNKIVYSKLSEDNPDWTKIHDLYIYDIDEDEEIRITEGLRADNPNVSNDGKKVVFLFQKDGTTNVGTVDINGENFKRITFFENGEQVYKPKFSNDNSYVVFGYVEKENRDVAKVNVDGAGFEVLLSTDADERDPRVMHDGSIIYSSDETGIFNIYKWNPVTDEKIQLSNVMGGAFMPDVDESGNIVYAGYTSSGYKIFHLANEIQSKVNSNNKYVWTNNPPLGKTIPNGDIENFNISSLKNYDDTNLEEVESERYSGFFSKMTFLPFIRYDNYNTSNTGLDKIKPGVYITSSDFLNRYSLFGGASINKRFERDMFLIFEYRNKLPLFYQLGLFPQLSLELYSISRKTSADLLFGVDSTGGNVTYDYKVATDVSYNLFEVDFALKHKIFAEGNDIELRYIYSDYTATLNSFILPDENNTLYPTTKDTYLIGSNFQLKFTHDGQIPHRDSDINPKGREVELQYNYELNQYNPDSEYEVADGILKPLYKDFNFHRVELNWKEYFGLGKGHTLSAQVRAASILGPSVPDFFDFYLGGLIGMKSYPFYAISGNELGWMNLTYRFPLFKNIDARLGHIYLDKIFLSVYGDYGNAWTGDFPEFNKFKKGAGAELRIKMISFYLFPTSLFFSAAYSFDDVSRHVRGEVVNYGKEWRFYGGILFDFSL